MPTIRERKTLPYSSANIFELVANVEDYPNFLPWAKSARVYNKTESNFNADLTIGYKMFEETYTSKVELLQKNNDNFQVRAFATHGPFEYLINSWDIQPLERDMCEVAFFLEFSFKQSWFARLLTPMFHQATQKMMEAFEKRAHSLFGSNS